MHVPRTRPVSRVASEAERLVSSAASSDNRAKGRVFKNRNREGNTSQIHGCVEGAPHQLYTFCNAKSTQSCQSSSRPPGALPPLCHFRPRLSGSSKNKQKFSKIRTHPSSVLNRVTICGLLRTFAWIQTSRLGRIYGGKWWWTCQPWPPSLQDCKYQSPDRDPLQRCGGLHPYGQN